MNIQELESLILETKGRFFSITFEKKDGSIRTVNGKNRFNSLIKGTGSPATDALKAMGYKSFVDRNKKGWASALPEKVKAFKCGAIEKTF